MLVLAGAEDVQDQVLHVKPRYQKARQKTEDLQGQYARLGIVTNQVMFDTLQKDLFVRQIGFNLTTAFLENLGHYLGPELICRVCKYICNFKYNAVKKLRVLQRRR